MWTSITLRCGLVLQLMRYCRHRSCGDCDEVFLSARALSAHRFMQHGIKLTCRDNLTETHCPVCLNEFHTRARLVVHVSRASPICKSVLEKHCGPEPPELVAQAEEVSKQQDREYRPNFLLFALKVRWRRLRRRLGSLTELNAVGNLWTVLVFFGFCRQGSKDITRPSMLSGKCVAGVGMRLDGFGFVQTLEVDPVQSRYGCWWCGCLCV